MNKLRFILPALLLSNLLCFAQESQINIFPSKENIQLKKERIAKDSKIGQKIAYTAMGLSAAVTAVLIYKFTKYFFSTDKIKIVKSGALSNLELTEKYATLDKLIAEIKEPEFLSKTWFKKIGESAAINFFTSSLAGICVNFFNDLYKRYSGFYNLNEFIGNKAKTVAAFDLFLQEAIIFDEICLENNSQNNPDSCDNKELKFKLIAKIRNIVDEFESIIAFMQYRIESFENIILTREDLLIPDYLFNCVNDYCKKLQALLADKTCLELNSDLNNETSNNKLSDNSQNLHDLSLELRNNAFSIISTFEGLEARIAWLAGAN